MQNRRQTRKEKITDSPKGRKVREKFAEEKKATANCSEDR